MSYALNSLLRNLLAGLRVAFLLPVTRFAFRIDLAQLVLLFVTSAVLDMVRDALRAGPDRVFSLLGAGSEFFGGGVLLFIAALLALLFRQRAVALSLPVMVLASLPAVQVALELPSAFRALGMPGRYDQIAGNVLLVWAVVVLIRCAALALDTRGARRMVASLASGLLLASPIWFSSALAPNDPWFVKAPDPEAVTGVDAGAEPVLATQSFLLDQLLGKLEDERPGITDLYFVGFAPYGAQDVFRKDVEAARDVMDERWGTKGRSIVLLNNPQTLLTAPFATITNLRETLNEIGAAIDADNDVVMVYLASHGSPDFRLAASQPPLTLVELTPSGLRQMLDDANIKWRIVVVSACFSGGYIEPLKDDHTIVITAARSDRISFGCGDRSDATFFGEAFFQKGMATADTITAAFDAATKGVAARERAEGYAPPSEPQVWVGPDMAEKLKTLRTKGQTGGVSASLSTRNGIFALPAAKSSLIIAHGQQ
ncbi:MAG: C13 family peptidase [Betaproteobacteria bacterium]